MAAEVWDDTQDAEFAFIIQPSTGILIDMAIYSLDEYIHPFIYSAGGEANSEFWTVVSNTGSSEVWT